MATTVRFDTLREAVRVLCGLPTFDDSPPSPVTLTEVNTLINAAVRRYFGVLLELKADEYTTFEETITVNAASYNTSGLTAARFHDVRAAHWVRGTDDIVELRRGALDSWFQRSESARTWDSSTCPEYALIRGLLYFFPVPSSSYTVRLWYTGIPADLSADSDTIDGGPGWEDFVIADVCLHIVNSQEEDGARFEKMLLNAERTIRGQKRRDRSSSRQVRDTRGVRPETRVRAARRFPWWS